MQRFNIKDMLIGAFAASLVFVLQGAATEKSPQEEIVSLLHPFWNCYHCHSLGLLCTEGSNEES